MLAFDKFEDVIEINRRAKSELQELTAIEYYDKVAMGFVNDHLKLDSPFEKKYNYYMLIEVGGNDEEAGRSQLEKVFDWSEKIKDGVIS